MANYAGLNIYDYDCETVNAGLYLRYSLSSVVICVPFGLHRKITVTVVCISSVFYF